MASIALAVTVQADAPAVRLIESSTSCSGSMAGPAAPTARPLTRWMTSPAFPLRTTAAAPRTTHPGGLPGRHDAAGAAGTGLPVVVLGVPVQAVLQPLLTRRGQSGAEYHDPRRGSTGPGGAPRAVPCVLVPAPAVHGPVVHAPQRRGDPGLAGPTHRARRQQESRSVSAALAGPGSQITRCAGPSTSTFAGDAHCLARPSLRRLGHSGLDQFASMFARMSRYAPALLGIDLRAGVEMSFPVRGKAGVGRITASGLCIRTR